MQLKDVHPLRVERGEYKFSAEHGRRIYYRNDQYYYLHRMCCLKEIKVENGTLLQNQVPGLSDKQKEMLNAIADANENVLE